MTFFPISADITKSSIKYTFQPVFQPQNVILNCTVLSIKGFQSIQQTTFVLTKKSSSNAAAELSKLVVQNITNEADSLSAAN